MRKIWQNRWLRVLCILILAGAMCYTVLLGVVLSGEYDQVEGQPQTMIVLGCQVHPWGPSILLRDRLDTAVDYLAQHPDMTVIVSGGKGDDEHASEASVMRDYLVSSGVPGERILVEDVSRNTYQNMIYSQQMMQQQGLDPADGVLVVSSGFHLTRARMLWDRVTGQGKNLSTLAAPSTHAPSRLWMYIREPLALVKSFIVDR
ncbi:MAG: YdcF family protein [Oscillospiraceae bacterium]|nr:YdcF family protein [Oscillospiraceae bacterium]